MRIILLSWEFPPHSVGGLGKHVADLVPALAAQGIDVHVVTPQVRGGALIETPQPGVTIHRTPLPPEAHHFDLVAKVQISNAALEERAQRLCAALPIDLIHCHDWMTAHSSVALKHALRLPLVATVHSMEHGRMQGNLSSEQSLAINNIEWWLTFEAWRVITVSAYMARQVRQCFAIPTDKLDIVPNGVNLPDRPPLRRAEHAAFRATFAAPDERIVYYVGRLVHEKGVQVLIDAAPQMLSRMPNLKLVIAGTGDCLHMLRERARERGVADHVVFTGFISDDVRDKLYQIADVAVFPSLYEPFGIVALEAMAAGCPVVVSETGGLAEFVRPHETGITVQPGDAASLAWGLLHTLQHPDWAAERAARALEDVRELFNWPRIATQTIATYRRVYAEWEQTDWGRRESGVVEAASDTFDA